MEQETILRETRLEDWKDFHELDKVVFPVDQLSESFFHKRLDRKGFYVLEKDKRIIGELILAPYGDDEGVLGRIAISPSERGRGYGKLLMQKAMNWFERESIRTIHLNTQHHNEVAQSLYRQFGFERSGTSWQYVVPLNSISPTYEMKCKLIDEEEIEVLAKKYESFPAGQIRRYIEYPDDLVFTLNDGEGTLTGACRFTPSFPGCFPFEVDEVESFDDFIEGLAPYRQPEFDFIRITFRDNEELAKFFENRNYEMHERLYRMTAHIET